MIKVEEKERIRRAYYVEQMSIRQIRREMGYARQTIRKALDDGAEEAYTLKEPRHAPVLGPYKAQIEALVAESERLPRKQRYTGHKIFELVCEEGYRGSESGVRHYVAQVRKKRRRPKIYLPLEFDPGTDGQVDWGEAVVIMQGQQMTVQLFVLRLCYSRRLFVMAFPCQKQEAFFEGHVRAFHHLGGIPYRLSYDNLKAAVQKVLQGKKRQEQRQFIAFRSHYLFESHFCTPGAGHEKGRVEEGIGYVQRNFLSPLVQVDNFEELNAYLLQRCLKDDQRRVEGQAVTIHTAWQQEKSQLRALPVRDFDCCQQRLVTLNGYGQVTIDTNRYSVPADKAAKKLRAKLYAFHIEVFRPDDKEPIACHPRCYAQHQDILDPLHYLPLLEQRPGAFNYAKPIRHWRTEWPPVYEQLLERLQTRWSEGQGIREFVRVLKLHQTYPATLIEQAVQQALTYNCAHADGVTLCLRQLLHPELGLPDLDLSEHPQLLAVGQQPVDLGRYDTLLEGDRCL
jgi:transposase